MVPEGLLTTLLVVTIKGACTTRRVASLYKRVIRRTPDLSLDLN